MVGFRPILRSVVRTPSSPVRKREREREREIKRERERDKESEGEREGGR
jgi:hypothetical protein